MQAQLQQLQQKKDHARILVQKLQSQQTYKTELLRCTAADIQNTLYTYTNIHA